MNSTDRQLGMDKDISRRDFLNGVSIAIGASLLPGTASALDVGAQDIPGYYPPELTGMRGSHPGSFEIAHMVRDGVSFDAMIRASATILLLSVAVSAVCLRHISTNNQRVTTPGY